MEPSTLISCVLIFIGAGFGALSRYGIENLGFFDANRYYYTTTINLTGCLVIGILWALFQHWHLSRGWYFGAITGFLGGYTTYSTFAIDAVQLINNGRCGIALFYVGITVIGGLSCCALGLYATTKLLK